MNVDADYEEEELDDEESDYTEEQLNLMAEHQLSESEFDHIYLAIRPLIKEYGTETFEAMFKLVADDLTNEITSRNQAL